MTILIFNWQICAGILFSKQSSFKEIIVIAISLLYDLINSIKQALKHLKL